MAEDSGEKTEEPTPHKLREARKKGQIAKGKELTGAILLFVSFYTLKAVASYMWLNMVRLSHYTYEQIPREFSSGAVGRVMYDAMWLMIMTLSPIFAAVFFVAILVEVIQTGFLVSFEPLTPNFEKLNPIEGVKNMFSMKQVVELLKSVIKMGIVIWIIVVAVQEDFPLVLQSQFMTLWQIMAFVGEIVMRVVTRVGMIYFVIAILDYFYQRYEYNKEQKMTKKEVKEEYKRLEGDPMIKQRQRDAQRQMAQGRQMGAVPGADVVVTNPIHIAIAIQYKANEMTAPTVVAKGKRIVADEIRQIAEDHYVPIVENPPLAQSLYKTTPIGAVVPSVYFKAVAEILAFVYNLKKKRRQQSGAPI